MFAKKRGSQMDIVGRPGPTKALAPEDPNKDPQAEDAKEPDKEEAKTEQVQAEQPKPEVKGADDVDAAQKALGGE
jgi:hypothetical protein